MIIHDCEQGSEEWFSLRAGMPTASEYSKIVTSKGDPSKSMEAYARRLAAELYAGKPLESFEGNFWTDRGKEMEVQAADQYMFIKDRDVEVIGFVTDDLARYGCSPDRMVGKDGMLEIKSLKTENHVAVIQYHQKHRKAPSDYIAQTQGQLLVCEREWSDLMFFHPDLPPVIIRQERDTDFIKKLQSQLALTLEKRDEILRAIKSA